ncbi:hypothetical protein ACA910_020257 [Epithemia clementina (nom. ined.)]
MIVWVHFGLVKFEEQKATVPEGAPFYWWKRIAPALEFGSMHAILFQMALIPLTMSRCSIAALSETVLQDFVPLNRAVRIHIHLGYVMVLIVGLATSLFFIFFGRLCAGGQQDFCDKFRQEIMITGYIIVAFLIVIGATSHFRHRMHYEVFYAIHHLVFILYLVTVFHTVDSVQRNNERNRSQTFKWFSSTILWYVCDRMAMRINHSYKARVVSASAVRGSDGSRMLLLKIRKPVLFQFKPGQCAYLKCSAVDQHWHPFSIASDPASRFLEFYIEVFGPETWTGRFWDLLKQERDSPLDDSRIGMDVMGPFGTSLGKTENFSHGLAIGAGTGIVPILSMFKQHVCSVIRLSPTEYFKASDENNRLQMDYEVARDKQKGSFAGRFATFWKKRMDSYPESETLTRMDIMQRSIKSVIVDLQASDASNNIDAKMLKWAASNATRSIYGVLLLAFISILGVTVFGLTISWNTVPVEIYDGMRTTLKIMTVMFQVCFAVPVLFIWDGNNFFAFIDFAMCLVSIPADIIWFNKYNQQETLGGVDLTLFAILTGYMIGRLWVRTVCHRQSAWMNGGGMKRLEVVWVARSAPLISEIVPEINALWDELVSKWGMEDALKVCRFSIYCTDTEECAVDQLRSKLFKTSLYQQGFVHFGRPEFDQIIENQTLEVIDESRTSSTLLVFCGSPELAETVRRYHVSNSMLAAVTGHKKHQMHFISESYGGVKKAKKQNEFPDGRTCGSADKEEHFDATARKAKLSHSDFEVPTF